MSLLVAQYKPSDPFPLDELPPSLSTPYIVTVPAYAGSSIAQLKLKSEMWPTLFSPRTNTLEHIWTPEEIDWARQGVHNVLVEARRNADRGDVRLTVFLQLGVHLTI